MEFMKDVPDDYYELAIVDVPYGIKENSNRTRKSKNSATTNTIYNDSLWACSKPVKEYFEELKRVSKNQIIWGGNYFTDNLEVSRSWVVWDKHTKHSMFADAELAWTSFKRSVKIFDFAWCGMLQGDMKNKQKRIHPTEKPIALYKWLLQNYAKEGDKILDTHGGSMSIAIACHDMSFDLDLCELDKDYFEAGKKRLEKHQTQSTLLDFC